MKGITTTLLMLCAAVILSSQSVHFGTAAVSVNGEFDTYYGKDSTTGTYLGASNSFPASTVVTVTNPVNGKTVSVTIVKRLSRPGLFLVLSPEAGKAIDLPSGDVQDIQAVERRKNEEAFSSYAEDKPFSDDPDLNPSAELAAAEEPAKAVTGAAPVSGETAAKAQPEESLPPVESSVNEYIPPVVMNSEGTAFEEGYDPLVLLGDSAAEEEVPEIIDEPEALLDSMNEPDYPLPERFADADLPDTFDPGLPGEEPADTDFTMVPAESEPAEALSSGDIDPALNDTTLDDLLISEPAFAESKTSGPDLTGVSVSEPQIGELPADQRETLTMIPESESNEDSLNWNILEAPVESVPATPREEAPVVISAGEEGSDTSGEIIIAEPLIPDETLHIEEVVVAEPEPEETTAPAAAGDQPVIVEPAAIPEEDKLTMTTPAGEPDDNVIYFLTPGDFRPPPKTEKKEKEPEKVVVPLTVERSELEGMIVRELRNGGSYLQLGTYRSQDVLYNTIKSISDHYPIIVLTVGEGNSQMYKLLIGPIMRDEKGIVITRFRSVGYGDAFLYSPH